MKQQTDCEWAKPKSKKRNAVRKYYTPLSFLLSVARMLLLHHQSNLFHTHVHSYVSFESKQKTTCAHISHKNEMFMNNKMERNTYTHISVFYVCICPINVNKSKEQIIIILRALWVIQKRAMEKVNVANGMK